MTNYQSVTHRRFHFVGVIFWGMVFVLGKHATGPDTTIFVKLLIIQLRKKRYALLTDIS